jgi:uncharacterized protein YigE (DUF2233 family)
MKTRITHYLIACLLIAGSLLGFCSFKVSTLKDEQVISYAYTPGNGQLRLFWKDDRGKILGNAANLNHYLAGRGQQLLFAMNGGMYQQDQSPQGLYIEAGKTLNGLNKNHGSGNFFLKPNGVFYITSNHEGTVCTTERFRPNRNILFATQSGPMLVINGQIHAQFKAGSTNVNIRNGVGILPDHRILFVMSKVPVSLYDFADYFRRKGCKNALYLDGFVSRTYAPASRWTQTDGGFGVMIGVVR